MGRGQVQTAGILQHDRIKAVALDADWTLSCVALPAEMKAFLSVKLILRRARRTVAKQKRQIESTEPSSLNQRAKTLKRFCGGTAALSQFECTLTLHTPLADGLVNFDHVANEFDGPAVGSVLIWILS